jgi:membrane protease YdiL (CAAX protease family)/Tfp pilus assembly protein PilF
MRARGYPALVLSVLLLALAGTLPARAQNGLGFNADTYYQQCLRFEAGGDLETARSSCLNALQINPDLPDAALALSRIEVELGRFDDAQSRLEKLKNKTGSAEPYLLLAQIALHESRYGEMEGLLHIADARLQGHYNSQFAAERSYLAAQLAQHRGDYKEALITYQTAISIDSLNPSYPQAAAGLHLKLGHPQAAVSTLEAYQNLTGKRGSAAMLALLGHAEWASGNLTGAAQALELALNTPATTEALDLGGNLRALTAVYYGQGAYRSGALALNDSLRRGNLLSFLLGHSLLWLLLLLLLCALHLLGESRIATSSSLEIVEGPQLWSVGQVYTVLIGALVVAAAAAVVYGEVRYHNFLAFLTPVQEGEVRALFLLVLAALLLLLALRRVKKNGWEPLERLLGASGDAPLGFGLGLALLVITGLYLVLIPHVPWLQGFYLNYLHLTPLLIAAAIALPLAELFFRAFVIPPLRQRYGAGIALWISSLLYALVLGAPWLLLLIFGFILGRVYENRRDGFVPMLAQLVLSLGLILGVALSGWVRQLFF